MLKHKYISVITLVILLVLLFIKAPLFYFLILLLVFFAIEFYGAASIQSGFHIQALCKGKGDEKRVAITFDDGPEPYTESVLKTLKDAGAKATFFLIGRKIKGQESILNSMANEGHIIGNHSFSHDFWFDLKNEKNLQEELERTSNEIQAVVGKRPLFFRPPYGVTTPALAKAIKKLNYETIGWNIRSFDTNIQDSAKVLERIKQQLVPGSIILLHDSIQGADILLKELLIYLESQQYKVVGLDQLLQKSAYA